MKRAASGAGEFHGRAAESRSCQDLRGDRAEVEFRSHAAAVGAGAQDRQQLARPRGTSMVVLAEDVARSRRDGRPR